MTAPTAFEQLTLELINRARLDPYGEYDRLVTDAPENVRFAIDYFDVDLAVLAQQFALLEPVAPVAWNDALGRSSQTHSNLMLVHDEQSHDLPGEPGLGDRIEDAGYTNFSRVGENIYAFAEDAFHAHAGFFIDWGFTPTGIQEPPGHRQTIMSASYAEIGVGHATDSDGATDVGPHLVTHHFGNRFGYAAQITGVVFDDSDGDRFYDIGEGKAGATITSGTAGAVSFASGGYNLAVASGTHTLRFTASDLGTADIAVSLGSENVKVDMYDPGAFRSSTTASLGAGAVALELLGSSSIDGTGNALDNALIGNRNANTLSGGAGFDTLIGGAGNDTLNGGANPSNQGDFLLGGSGDDVYHVDSALDFVDEGAVFPEFGLGGFDVIVSTADFFWDLYSVGETLRVSDEAADPGKDGVTAVGSVFDSAIIGHSGTDILFGRGGSDTYRAGDGIDFMSLSTLGVPDAPGYTANGVNTVVVEQRASGPVSYDIVFEFEAGRDKVDLSDYGFASLADAFSRGVNDGAGSSYFVLGDGFDYLYMVGLELSELSAGDFIV